MRLRSGTGFAPLAAILCLVRRRSSSDELLVRRRREPRLGVVVVVPTDPALTERGVDLRLVSPARCPVEPLVHAPEIVHPARVGRIGVVDDVVLERESAHTPKLARVGRPVRADPGCELGDRPLFAGIQRQSHVDRAEVVLEALRLLLLRGERDPEVVVEVTAVRRRPREAPAHPALVRLQLLERGSRHGVEGDVVVREVDDEAVEAVRDRRTRRAPRLVFGPEHEVVDEELRATVEEIGERGAPLVGLEAVLLLDSHPRQLLPRPGQLVAAPGQLLLGLEQSEPGGQPLFTRSCSVVRHSRSPLPCHIVGVRPGIDDGATTTRIPMATIATASGASMNALGGMSFWTSTTAATTPIQARLMTPSATSITINPMLEPTQSIPNSNPDQTLSRQHRRKPRLSGVSSYAPPATVKTPATNVPCG